MSGTTKRSADYNYVEGLRAEVFARVPRWTINITVAICLALGGFLVGQYRYYSELISTVDALSESYPELKKKQLALEADQIQQQMNYNTQLSNFTNALNTYNLQLQTLRAELKGAGVIK